MQLSQMQSEVVKMLGNLQSGHPLYSLIYPATGSESTNILLRAANRIIRLAYSGNRANADLFPELKNTWTIGPTVASSNAITRPTDCIAIQSVTCGQQSTLPDWNTVREYPVTYMDRLKFGYLVKDSTITDYPHLYSLKGKSLLIHPTPSASFISYLRIYGIAAERALVLTTDTFFMDPDWHSVVVTLAAGMIAEKLSWDQAPAWISSAYDEVGRAADVSALQGEVGSASVDGSPSRDVVYGGM